MNAKTMLENKWCDDCTGDVKTCQESGICEGSCENVCDGYEHERMIDYLYRHPAILANMMISMSMQRETIVLRSPAGTFTDIEDATAKTVEWLQQPFGGEENA